MRNAILATVLMVSVFALLSGCATMPQTWPDYERSAENKMVVIQEKIGDGLKTNALSPDQSQAFLTTLKGIRTDYTALRDKKGLPRRMGPAECKTGCARRGYQQGVFAAGQN